jgi:hypothetical protein
MQIVFNFTHTEWREGEKERRREGERAERAERRCCELADASCLHGGCVNSARMKRTLNKT